VEVSGAAKSLTSTYASYLLFVVIAIAVTSDGRYHPLGSYTNPQQAADDIAGGHTHSIASGVDTAKLAIPEELEEWERLTNVA